MNSSHELLSRARGSLDLRSKLLFELDCECAAGIQLKRSRDVLVCGLQLILFKIQLGESHISIRGGAAAQTRFQFRARASEIVKSNLCVREADMSFVALRIQSQRLAKMIARIFVETLPELFFTAIHVHCGMLLRIRVCHLYLFGVFDRESELPERGLIVVAFYPLQGRSDRSC